MSQAINSSCPALTPSFNMEIYHSFYFTKYRQIFVLISLLVGLYGVLTILSTISCYALVTRQSAKKIQLTTVILCLTIATLFISTTTYMVASLIVYHANLMSDILYSAQDIWFFSIPTIECLSPDYWETPLVVYEFFNKATGMYGCISASTLTVNVILGDAIVCWRTCVVWHRNHIVKAICGIFLLATLSLGVIDTCQSCVIKSAVAEITSGGGLPAIPGTLFEGIPIGVAASTLSLGTNVLATLLVTYKAWQSRRHLKKYLIENIRKSPVEALLTLLIESGAIYSAIWLVVVAFQIIQQAISDWGSKASGYRGLVESNFILYFGLIINGALVPAIAIYPTIIIVIVALNKSHMERGISQHLESMPTPHLDITANTVITSLDESHSDGRSEVPAFDRQELGDEDTLEDMRRISSEE